MKAFPGKKCSICKQAIPTGTDIHYDGETKTVQHWECFEQDQPPGAAEHALADSLGFVRADDVEGPGFSAVCQQWCEVRSVRPADRGTATGRFEPAPRRDEKTTLF